MIAKLRGIIDTLEEDRAIVDVNGVGYLVYASAKTLGRLTRGQETSLWIETVVREDSISLFGFLHPLEKEWFLTLTKVQGVGAKVCLNILSVLTPAQLVLAVAAQDKASFARAGGVGPKLAARIVSELKGKTVSLATDDVGVNEKKPRRRIPYSNMIYIGDGMTDIPSMIIVKNNGGKSIAVYPKGNEDRVASLYEDERVNYACVADYSSGKTLEKIMQLIIEGISINESLRSHEKEKLYSD